ncbi:dimethyl sulfoxide reductase anchor subunit [Aromatoleum toluclasticum]|uniref:DmsC/YnfH family molybdoenzyme membrane anchor subunit n=1 Tax=Aromatoleum toluclasticum TaxID=92003 RepID=UPI001D180DB6|nr:DmsC/YnfH family molybdoenzyme membrane anchor subunit [Aromatoleum toluclasticum]MCC4114759.1 dimethyl sulfoxide reductase anchor subunit [Aromatoleum toluclasticum]
MSLKYQTGVRFNHHLGPQETLSFMGEGVGAALFAIALFTDQPLLAGPGILFVIGAVFALLGHLGNPQRAWRAITRIGTSWVSRGTLFISIFIGVATLSLVAGYLGMTALQQPLAVAALVVAVPVMGYAGMLLRSMRAVRLWRGPFVPLAFVAHSLATALILAWALIPLLGGAAAWLQPAAMVALVASALLSVLHLLRAERSEGVRASFERLFSGDLRTSFLVGGCVCGIVVPLVVTAVLSAFAGGIVMVLMLAVALCRLYGDFAYRNAVVIAGAYEPVMPDWPMRSSTPPAAPVACSTAAH